MKEIDELINELNKFSDNILTLNQPLLDVRTVTLFEKKHNFSLPLDYKYFLSTCNGLDLMGVTIYGFNENEECINNVYDFEHFNVEFPQYSYLVPFSPDGGGNFYCFDTSQLSERSCKIIFWESNHNYTSEDTPEIVNNSFTDWIKQVVIEWTLDDYDYNGNVR